MIERLETFYIYQYLFFVLSYNYLNKATNHQPYWGVTAPLLGKGHGPKCTPSRYDPVSNLVCSVLFTNIQTNKSERNFNFQSLFEDSIVDCTRTGLESKENAFHFVTGGEGASRCIHNVSRIDNGSRGEDNDKCRIAPGVLGTALEVLLRALYRRSLVLCGAEIFLQILRVLSALFQPVAVPLSRIATTGRSAIASSQMSATSLSLSTAQCSLHTGPLYSARSTDR